MKTCIGCRINRIVWPKVDTALMKHGPCYMPSQVLGDMNEHKDVQRLWVSPRRHAGVRNAIKKTFHPPPSTVQ